MQSPFRGITIAASATQIPRPTPAAGIEAYERERDLALDHDPRRRENYARYLACDRSSTQLDFLPIKLDIENVSRCNFRCTMCQVSDWEKGQRAEDMPFEAFKQLLEEQYGVIEIKLQGMGEPILQGNAFFNMIEHARSTHIWVRTITNGSLLHLKDNYRKLIDADPNEVQISIDGADKEVFEGIRRQSRFDQVIENCRTINAYCESQSVVRTKMWTVVQKDNSHQLRELVDLAAELGFRSQCFSLSLTGWGQEKWEQHNDEVTVSDATPLDTCLELIERGARQGVDVAFWDIEKKFNTRSVAGLCHWPFERTYVSSDMRAVPCCMIGNPQVLDLGDATDLRQTWNGASYQEFRQAHLEGNIPQACAACYESGPHALPIIKTP